MEYPFEITGRIVYDPRRGDMKARVKNWCVVEIDCVDLIDYYRWFVDKNWWDADTRSVKRTYHRAAWGSHISVIRGEYPKQNQNDWGKYRANERVSIRYNGMIRQTSNAYYADEPDKFWFIDAQWDEYVEFRKHFGLSWNHNGVPFRPHITVARTYE